MQDQFKFEYAIQNSNGECYKGTAYGDSRDWTTTPMDVFTYSETGANKKIQLFPIFFRGCTVVQYA